MSTKTYRVRGIDLDHDGKRFPEGSPIELDDEAFDRLYGFVSHPIATRPGQRVAVRVVSQFGEESTKVLGL